MPVISCIQTDDDRVHAISPDATYLTACMVLVAPTRMSFVYTQWGTWVDACPVTCLTCLAVMAP